MTERVPFLGFREPRGVRAVLEYGEDAEVVAPEPCRNMRRMAVEQAEGAGCG